MKNFTLRAFGAAMLLGTAAIAYGVPANPLARVFTQPDGTQVTLSQRGDEHCNYMVSRSGQIVLQDADGWYRIVAADGSLTNLTPSDFEMKASDVQIDCNPQMAVESLMSRPRNFSGYMSPGASRAAAAGPSRVIAGGKYDNADGHDIRAIPTTGSPHVLVILVNFSDKKFSYCSNPRTEMQNMMMQKGYSNFNSTGSAFDFYSAQSLGLYTPQFDVFGPVDLPNPSSYYAAGDAAAVKMVIDATKLLDKEINYSLYDTNNDGYVDNVYIFYAGYGQNDGGGSTCIWPHSWEVQRVDICPELDGVKINHYACSNELNFNYGSDVKDPTGIGTFCHEFGHVLGQPDMYSVSYNDAAFTPGSYSAMDHGSYNNNGRTPPNFSAYERYAMEWIKPIDITEATSIHMLPIADGGNCYKINIDPANPTEYWLFENRQQTGWDTYIPGHGMLIWHIDYVASIWNSNKVNDDESKENMKARHQHVDIVEADGIKTDGSRAGDTFPGTSNITAFTASTVPAFCTWSGTNTTLPINNITETPTGVIGFDVAGGSTQDALAVALPKPRQTAGTDSSITVEWAPVNGAVGYTLSAYSRMMDQMFGEIITEMVPGYELYDVDLSAAASGAPAKTSGKNYAVTIDGLAPATSYVVNIYARTPDNISPAGESTFTTFSDNLQESIPNLTVEPDAESAEMLWAAMDQATDYSLTVATRAEGAPVLTQESGFDNRKLPDNNWLFDGSFDTRVDYSGMATPSLRFSSNGVTLSSWIYNEDIAEIDFWARVSRKDAIFSLDFYGVEENGALMKFASVTELDGTKEGSQVRLTNIPDGFRQFICIYNYTTTDLSLNLDDIKVYLRGSVTDTPLPGYDGKSVSGNSHTVAGLQKSTDYVAMIQARNAAGSSRPSRAVRFTTLAQSGIDHAPVVSDSPVFVVTGGVLRTDASEPFSLYSVDGKVIATGVRGSIRLPAPGIYVVRCGSEARTIRY